MARSDSDCGLETIALPRAEEGESCQIERPCPEKLSAPEPVRFEVSTGATCESAGGKPITDVRGAEDWPCRTNIVEPLVDDPLEREPPKKGVRTTAFEEPEFETGSEERAGGAPGCEFEAGAERAGAEWEGAGAECEPPPPPQ